MKNISLLLVLLGLLWNPLYGGIVEKTKEIVKSAEIVNNHTMNESELEDYLIKLIDEDFCLNSLKEAIVDGVDIDSKDAHDHTALMTASIQGYLKVAQYLVENGADVNIKDPYGTTTLMFASEFGYIEIVKLLIKNGADINAMDEDGQTALDIAKNKGHKEIAEYLESLK